MAKNTGFMGKVPNKRRAEIAAKNLNASTSTPTKPTDINSGVDASPTNMGVSIGPKTGSPEADPKPTPKTAPVAKPTTKSAPVAKPTTKSAPTSKYRGGRSEEDINRMINEATPERMRGAQFEKDNPDATPYKKGGVVKSGASRGDGCAQRGRTKGRMV